MSAYATCVERFIQSDIRNPLYDKPDMISFSAGRPDAAVFPLSDISTAFHVLFSKGELVQALQYGTTEGLGPLREKLAAVVMKEAGVVTDTENIMITTGSQQGINFSAQLFVDPGDTVICETPTYLGALNTFSVAGAQCIGIPVESDGMNIEALQQTLEKHRDAKFIYTIPDFQNPTGSYMSLKKRKQIAELAAVYGVPVIEDAPYSEIRFTEEKLPPIKSFDTSGMVIYLSTFSKTLCPGLRIGWICADTSILQKYVLLKGTSDSQSSTIDQFLAYYYLTNSDWKARVASVRLVYLKRRNTMIEAIKKYLPDTISYVVPEGGFFVWLKLPILMDDKELLNKTTAFWNVSFVPGSGFFPEKNKNNYIRLSYSNTPVDAIPEGIKRLGQALQ